MRKPPQRRANNESHPRPDLQAWGGNMRAVGGNSLVNRFSLGYRLQATHSYLVYAAPGSSISEVHGKQPGVYQPQRVTTQVLSMFYCVIIPHFVLVISYYPRKTQKHPRKSWGPSSHSTASAFPASNSAGETASKRDQKLFRKEFWRIPVERAFFPYLDPTHPFSYSVGKCAEQG